MRGYKCKKCDMKFDDKKHYEVHKDVHKHVKSRISQYGTDMPWRPGL
jgi:tRNA(Ile2) C34 agmatinyltransferase TiaS